MNMKLSKERVGEKLRLRKIYEIEKDNAFPNSIVFKDKMKVIYNLEERLCSELYAMVINHQVETYGQNLSRAFVVNRKIKRTDNIFKKRVRR